MTTTTTNTYNGWTNYATWRINLEMFDGLDPSDYFGIDHNATPSDLAEILKEYAEERIHEDASHESFALSYALAFISDVNWHEIAELMIEAYETN